MLLAIDIGNTTVALGVFEGGALLKDWSVRSEREKTADEYSIVLLELLRLAAIDPAAVGGVIISSVVPPLTPAFLTLSQDLFGIKALVVGPGLRTGMPILYENPGEVGADRVVASIAAFEKHGGPCIIVDFGTATTFDAVSARGEYLGGAIAPGIQISAEALYLSAFYSSMEFYTAPAWVLVAWFARREALIYYNYRTMTAWDGVRVSTHMGSPHTAKMEGQVALPPGESRCLIQ